MTPTHKPKEKLGTLEMIAAMFISGSIGLFVIKSEQPPADIVFFRCVIAFLCLLPMCFFSGQIKKEFLRPKKVAMMVASGLLLIFNWILLFKAFPLTSISLATIVYHVNPFIILFLGAVVLKEKAPPSDGVWTALAFVGLLIIVGIGQTQLSTQEFVGLGLVLIATSLYACSVLITKKLTGTPPLLIVMVQTLAGTLASLPLTSFPDFGAAAAQWPFIAALGVIHTALLYWLIYSAISKINLSAIAILSFIYPVSTIAFDYLFFDHVISFRQSIGAAMILVATIGVKLHWKLAFRMGGHR
jgi:drug/metabolite transporter (DMT)-like permease